MNKRNIAYGIEILFYFIIFIALIDFIVSFDMAKVTKEDNELASTQLAMIFGATMGAISTLTIAIGKGFEWIRST